MAALITSETATTRVCACTYTHPVVMAQIGSYVPAKSARLGMHDAILTRMGGMYENDERMSNALIVTLQHTMNSLRAVQHSWSRCPRQVISLRLALLEPS